MCLIRQDTTSSAGGPGRFTNAGHGAGRSGGLSIQTAGLSRRPRAQDGQSGSFQGVRGRAGLEEWGLLGILPLRGGGHAVATKPLDAWGSSS